MVEALLILLVVLALAAVAMLFLLLKRGSGASAESPQLEAKLIAFQQGQERGERALRDELAKTREETANSARSLRDEVNGAFKGINDSIIRSIGEISTVQKNQLEAFSAQLAKLTEANQHAATQHRAEMAAALKAFSESIVRSVGEISNVQKNQLEAFSAQLAKLTEANQQAATQQRAEMAGTLKATSDSALKQMSELAALQRTQLDVFATRLGTLTQSNEQKLEAMRLGVEQKLAAMQEDNGKRLELMRATVDEKLQGTLEKRLGESFKLVSERLEQVHKGLGEMAGLASGVGDLKRVLTNVKTRGTWGEIQLGNLLEQVLTAEQYSTNVAPRPGSDERVEFAIKLPGRDENDRGQVWLPIDAKFPIEDYQRLVEAIERADADGVEAANRQLETRIRLCARDICDKYLHPPHTTDFAIMYLPTEGLYAEVVRRTGTIEVLQRECRVIVAGPTTLAALLNSLQMGFRTLAIQKRSSEVWGVLGAVKNEFGKFGDLLDNVQKKLHQASNTIEDAARKTRTIERKLKKVQETPAIGSEQGLLEDIEEAVEKPVVDLHEGRES